MNELTAKSSMKVLPFNMRLHRHLKQECRAYNLRPETYANPVIKWISIQIKYVLWIITELKD